MPFEGGTGPSLQIKAAAGCLVRDPKTGICLSETSTTTVPNVSYWRRRVRAGDCVMVKEQTKPAPISK